MLQQYIIGTRLHIFFNYFYYLFEIWINGIPVNKLKSKSLCCLIIFSISCTVRAWTFISASEMKNRNVQTWSLFVVDFRMAYVGTNISRLTIILITSMYRHIRTVLGPLVFSSSSGIEPCWWSCHAHVCKHTTASCLVHLVVPSCWWRASTIWSALAFPSDCSPTVVWSSNLCAHSCSWLPACWLSTGLTVCSTLAILLFIKLLDVVNSTLNYV